MEKIGLVLSGGGSKGSYEIGVYKALRKLHIKPEIVTGTSIGAINGVLITQKTYRKTLRFWKQISFENIYSETDFPIMKDPKLKDIYAQYVKTFINEGGIDVTKIKKMFDYYFNPRKFFKSDINYGLVTYNLSKRKPVILTKKDLTKDNTRDYVLASASCYPAYKPYIIDDDMYIDGGYHDNIPINLAIDLGATKIIAVDLRAIGLKKKIKDSSVEVTYIAPRNKLASFLLFDGKKAIEGIKYGYNDTMKTFKKLDGNIFTFKKNNLIKNYNRYNDLYEDNLNKIFEKSKSTLLKKIFETPLFKEILNRKVRYNNFNNIIENAGKIFKFEEYNIYSINSFNKGLLNCLSNTQSINTNIIKNKIKDKKITKILDSRQIVKYFYICIITKDIKTMIKYIPIFRNEFLSALYIYTIKEEKITY